MHVIIFADSLDPTHRSMFRSLLKFLLEIKSVQPNLLITLMTLDRIKCLVDITSHRVLFCHKVRNEVRFLLLMLFNEFLKFDH